MFRKSFSSFLIMLFIAAAMFTLSMVSIAQDHDHMIPVGTNSFNGDAEGVQPGDVVCIEAGARDHRLFLENFNGTAENPVIIKNCGGQVVITSDLHYGIAVNGSNHFRLTGTGDEAFEYGIVVKGGSTMGVTVGGLSGDGIEVDHIHAEDITFAGFMVKTDPNCDPATWRENHVMRDVRVHHNSVYYTHDGEGFYIGFTFSDGYEVDCDGSTQTVYGHLIEDLQVYDNYTEDTGAEGIQISSSPGAVIRNNVVYKAGQRPFAQYQDNGVQIGYQDVYVYNNRIDTVANNGLIMFGTGHDVYNNVIVNTGSHGVFADDRKVGDGMIFANNTVVNAGADGFALYYDETTQSIVKNNLIVNPGDSFFRKLNDNVDVDESNNHFADTVAEVGFVDAANGNYRVTETAPVVDEGTDLSSLGITFDLPGTDRPQGAAFDIGAYEWYAGSEDDPDDPGGDGGNNGSGNNGGGNNGGETPQRVAPAAEATLGNGTAWLAFQFKPVNGVEWYGVWIGAGERDGYTSTALYRWFPASGDGGICTAATCTLPFDVWLTNGTFEWWMTYWGPTKQDYNSAWNKTTFTVDYTAPGEIERTPPGMTTTLNALTATYDPGVQWYQAWVGTADYQSTMLFNWFDARDICSGDTCTFDFSEVNFPAGDYEWWMEAWGPGGYRMWTDDTPLEFSVAP